MAKKGWRKQKRGFINPNPGEGCIDAFHWEVEVSRDADGKMLWTSASFSAGRDLYLSIERKANMRSIQNIRKALNEFEAACEEMLEEKNAKS